MRFSSVLCGVLLAIFVTAAGGAVEVVPPDVGGCPVEETWAVPAEALFVDAAGALDVPLLPDDDLLACDVVIDCGVHFQEIVEIPAVDGVVVLNGFSFRVDESTPLADVGATNCWNVEVGLGVFPGGSATVSTLFDENVAGDPITVFDGSLCLEDAQQPVAPGVGAELEIVFDEPFLYDPTIGPLVVDVQVDGLTADTEFVLLDAVEGPEVVTVVSLEGPDAPVGEVIDGGPVLVFDGFDGPSPPGDPVDCLNDLQIPDDIRNRLLDRLSRAEEASITGRPRRAEYFLWTYHRTVRRSEYWGYITSEAAEKAHEYGTRAGGIYLSPYLFAELIDDLSGFSAVLTVLSLEEIVGPQLPADSPAHDLMDDLDELLINILADDVVDQSDREDVQDWVGTFRGFLWRVWRDVTIETNSLLREAWQFIRDFWRRYNNDPEFRFLVHLWLIAGDGTITPDEADALKALRLELKELLKDLPDDSPLNQALKRIPSLMWQLAAKLAKGQIEYINIAPNEVGGADMTINTTEPIWIDVITIDLPEETPLIGDARLNLVIRISNAGFGWYATEDGHVIQIVTFDDDGEGGEFRLDLNAPDLTTVAALKVYFGFNLDNFQASKVTLTGEGGKEVVVEGTADGKTVRIEVQGDQVKVEVDGKQTFPK